MSTPAASRPSPQTAIEAQDQPALAISAETVSWIIAKARAFDAKEAVAEPDPGSNSSDDRMVEVLEDRPDDATEAELRSHIGDLSEDEQIDLVALMWLGRDDDSSLADWPATRVEAARARGNHTRHTADYLLGEPLVSDFLEEGLAKFGITAADFESGS